MKTEQRRLGGVADVEAVAGATQFAARVPTPVALHLIVRVEATGFDQTAGQTQRHAGVVGPLAGFEVERSAADHVGDGWKRATRTEFDGRADGIAARQT